MVDPINESPLRDLMKEFEDAIGRQDRAGAVALMRPFREEKDRYGTREIAGSSVVIRAREGLWPTNEQLADALRMAVFAGDEVDPELLLFIADALEQKADRRGAKKKPHWRQRWEDNALVERVAELERSCAAAGSRSPKADAYGQLAKERGWADADTAKTNYSKALKRLRTKG